MTLLTQAEFARQRGITPKTVSTWKKAGRLVMKGDQVDVEASIALLDRHRKGGAPGVTSTVTLPVTQADVGNARGNKPRKKIAEETRVTPDPEEIAIQPGESVEDAAARLIGEIDMDMSFDEARRMKEVYLVLLNRLEYEQKIGSLIELDLARDVFFELARAARDAWLNWPAKVAPFVASQLGVQEADKVTEVLAEHVHKQMAELGEPEVHFTNR
jgi:hypothetical protein